MIDPAGSKIIRSSDEVSLEPKVMRVLLLLAESPGETILRETFMDRVWAVEFGSDESLTRAVSILRKIFRDTSCRRPVIETIPRKGYRLVGTVSDTNPAAVEKQAVSANPDQGLPLPPQLRPKALWPWLAASFAAVCVIASMFYFNRSTEPLTVTSDLIRIASFNAVDSSNSSEALATTVESRITSVLTASGMRTTLRGNSDGGAAEFILFGDVWIEDGKQSVIVNLKHEPTGNVIWSNTIASTEAASLGFGSTVANHVSAVLVCLSSWRTPEYQNTSETLQLYARFCDAYEGETTKDLSVFTEPIYRAESDNPIAIALHATALSLRAMKMNDVPGENSSALQSESLELANEALRLAPDSVTVNALWALVHQHRANSALVDQKLSAATVYTGLPEIIYWHYSSTLRRVGRVQDARVMFQRLVAVDPTDAMAAARLGWLHATEGNDHYAERYFRMAEAIDPDSQELATRRRQVSLWLNDENGLRSLLNEQSDFGPHTTIEAETCLRAYIDQKLRSLLDKERLFETCTTVEPVLLARMLVGLGDVDGAYSIIAAFDWNDDVSNAIYLFYPDMVPFRADPRFWQLAEDIGLTAYWSETGRWPDFCRDERHPGHCPNQS